VRFDCNRVEKLIQSALVDQLKGRQYAAQDCKSLTKDVSADLLERVKLDQRDAGVRRYKYVIVVNVGSVAEHPDMQLSSRCLWVVNVGSVAEHPDMQLSSRCLWIVNVGSVAEHPDMQLSSRCLWVVNVGSVAEHPDMQLSSRCLWVPTTDGCATASYSNSSLFAVATVFAVYFE